ncbi:SGNH/GDSL hydrolase family protein [Amycolatopsis balhimycina DSM 5908]|uniref:SGNH/GDSL hydrolase family protein n=1 Tax=Amycolatopsis balhimycina DSM 5908 TaxID=1081091 RepID=A0A428WJK9_AMYBA|nr:SGNH/GDSL hydrolase family protein [Amycolatopsis balhimycina]RSM43212.1 SGNH/GDSL hydrolase family protein [Amycolatopsis balhimycina DSM 5908]
MPPPTVRHLAALGSSFASGPGIEPYADKRAWRSGRNYAHLLAERLGSDLTDLTVAGATTATILERPQRMLWRKFPAQLSRLPREADLVTVTAGGNDLGYISSMIALSYRAWLSQRRTTRTFAPLLARHGVPALTESMLDQTTSHLVAIVAAITKQAPGARVVLVDYLTVLDADTPTGPDAPFPAATRDSLRAVAGALADAFADAAKLSGADLVAMSRLSEGHGLTSAHPWVNGFMAKQPTASFHPTLTGMTAVADAVIDHLGR